MIFDIGYGLAAVSYSLFFFLLLTVRNAGIARHFLLLAIVVTVLWAIGHISFFDNNLGREKILLYDAIRQFVWILFLSACLKEGFASPWAFIKQKNNIFAMLLPTVTIAANLSNVIPGVWQFTLHTLVAVQALVMTEILFRQSAKDSWAFKPLIVFLAVFGILDFVTYANALMLNTLSWDFFAARGYIVFLLLPLLLVAVRRIKHWGIEIFVSREIVLQSSLLMLAGLYLLVMALLGYFIKYFGGDWNRSIQIALFVVGLIFLVVLLMSHQLRSSIKVFIIKHFYANQYDYRVEWVKLSKTLKLMPEDITGVYANALKGWLEGIGYDDGLLYKKNRNSMQLVASSPQDTVPIDERLIPDIEAFFANKKWVLDVDELQVKPEVYAELSNKASIINSCEKQLLIPMIQNDEVWGFVAMSTDGPNKRNLNWELRDYMGALSEQITAYVANAENSLALAENAQFAAFNRMSAFVVHDLKNVLAQINLIISNAAHHKHNPEFIDDTFETLEHTKHRMENMLSQLMQKTEEQVLNQESVDLVTLTDEVIQNKCKELKPFPNLQADGKVTLVINAEKMSNVLYHLISNAQQATSDAGSVTVQVHQTGNEINIVISDTGVGMTQAFIQDKLFKPFETTKGNAGMGIGAYDAKNFIEESGGSIHVTSELNQGSTFFIHLPKQG